jgi:lysophospholipase L1-like esterase
MDARDDTGYRAGVFVSAADLEQVAAARVYFGHQSVGTNLLQGLEDLQAGLDRPVIRAAPPGVFDAPGGRGVLLHSAIGRNGHPDSKCDDFRRVLDQLRGRLDVALFKFCYVDFGDTSDAGAIFAAYARTMDELKRRYPGVLFVHVTAPLRTVEGGPGVWLREAIGRRNRAKHANARRNEFNALLRTRYAGEPMFDLAAVEATRPDGRRQTFRLAGRTLDALVPAYTDDGGHLNEAGRVRAAAGLVHTLAQALRTAGRSGVGTDPAIP